MGREPFFNEKGASADAETPLLYPEPGMKIEIFRKLVNSDSFI